MAGFTEALRLIIDADTRGAIQGVEKLGATTDRELGKSQKSLDKWGNRLTSVGTGMVAFGAAAVVGLGALAMESEKANLAQVKLQNTIDNMPKLAGASAKEFTDLADSIQDVTAADADAIVEAEALLGTFQLTADEIKGITPLVVDYARKFGVDMADAAVQVGKALDGQAGALQRNGVSIDETLFKTDRYRAVQEALSDQVGGFAEAEGKTFAGSLERMKNELGDLAEGVGGGAVDAFTTMFGAVQKVAGALEGISPGTQNLIGKVATFGSVALIAAGGLNIIVGQAIAFRQSLSTIATTASTATAKLGGLKNIIGVGGLATAIAAAAGALELYNNEQQQGNISKGAAEFLAAGDSAEKMRRVLKSLSDQGAAEFVGTFQQLAETNHEAAERFLEQAEAAGLADKQLRQMRDALDTQSAAQQQSAEDTAAASGALDENADAADGAAESQRDLTSALEDYANALAAQFDPLFGMISAQESLKSAQDDVAEAQGKLNEALAGGDATAIADAQRDYEQALSGSREALFNVQQKQLALNDAIVNGDVNLEDAQEQMFNWAIQAGFTADQAAFMAGQLGGAADAAHNLGMQDPEVAVSIVGISAVMADVANIKRQLDSIPRTVQSEIITTFHSVFGGPPNPRGRQHGGPVRAGEAYIVGEKHEELFIPNENGTVLPDVPQFVPPRTGISLNGAGGNGGGGLTVNVTVAAPFGSPSEIGARVAEALRPIVRVQHGGNVQAALGFSR